MANYFMIPMDFLECDFARMKKEWDKNGKIMWEINGKVINNKINKNAFYANNIKEDDIIYFYVCHLPSNSGYNKSRVLLRGIVKDEPKIMDYSEVYINKNGNEEKIIGFSVGKLTTLNKNDLKNDNIYSLQELRTIKEFSPPQGKKWLNTITGNLDNGLIDRLEKSFKNVSNKSDFNNLIEHFNKKCFFSDKIGGKHSHDTFLRRNGTNYYEFHHFIQRYSKDKNLQLHDIIDDNKNLLCLCSNCHNKLHYGQTKDIEDMINVIWEDVEIQEMLEQKRFLSIIGVENKDEALEWIKHIYHLN